MGLLAVLFVSIVALTFSSFVMKAPVFPGFNSVPPPKIEYVQPARKSVLVAPDGSAHRTADGTQMTKRDRGERRVVSVPVPPPQEETTLKMEPPQPDTDKMTPSEIQAPQPAQDEAVQLPMQESGETAAPAAADELPAMSAGRKVKDAIVGSPELSYFTRTTIRITSEGQVVRLNGHVMDQNEKQRISEIAESIAGPGNVDNQLLLISDEPVNAPSAQ
jgi:hypothetical protein